MRRLISVAAAALLAACATVPVTAPLAQLSLPDQYGVSGRVAVRASGKGYPAARFDWQHQSGFDRVDISNPLGQIVARLELSATAARYIDSRGEAHEADDIETLTERELGWRLPADGLRFWLLGLAEPDHPAQWANDSEGRTLNQDGWQIRYAAEPSRTPTALTLVRPDLEIRIVLSDWQLTPKP
jgi:outer membrane lipoprotein LolB